MKSSAMLIGCSRRSERGVTLLLVAISLVVLLAIAALAIDLGVLYTARTSVQHAVDAAALAGAFTFQVNPNAVQPTTAADAVKSVLKANSVIGKQVNLDSLAAINNDGNGCAATVATPPFICVDPTNQRVTVAAAGPGATSIEIYFARIFGLSNVGVAAMATAEASKGAVGTYCLKPIFMPISGSWTDQTCSGTIFNSQGQLQSDLVGTPFTFWVKGSKNLVIPPSEDALLSINTNKGGSGIRDQFGFDGCLNMRFKCGDDVALNKPGGNNGPVTQGVDQMIGAPSQDTWQAVGQYCYQGNCSDVRDTSRSLATVIIWDCQKDPLNSGRDLVTVAGFGEVFIDGVSNSPSANGTTGGIQAHLITAASCNGPGGGGLDGGSGGSSSGAFAGAPVRLIQTPSGQ